MNYITPIQADIPADYKKVNVLNKEYEAAGFYVYPQHSMRNLGQQSIFIAKHSFVQNEQGMYLTGNGVDEIGRQMAKIKPVWGCTMELDVDMAKEFVRQMQEFIEKIQPKPVTKKF